MRQETAPLSKIQYDREACSRCGGTGHYSYNPMDGTICFRCRGAKKTLSKRAKKSHALVEEFKVGLLGVRASEIEVGDAFKSIGSNRRYQKVTEIRPVETNGGASGVTVGAEMFMVSTMALVAGGTGYNLLPDDLVLRFPDHDQFQQIAEFAMDLPGVEVS